MKYVAIAPIIMTPIMTQAMIIVLP